ncbi:hypothetical protein SLEP1_g20577 [Rubroshorea leprosula]|uniref:Uncharacterized protein n=1 Tax=Rubroshorea leprosula TaxID=152421 RepID=A0AAV5JDP0_9ROSI|nr:hypothetical protein SLEP1_g20577 [Rubroshorea leprosula]
MGVPDYSITLAPGVSFLLIATEVVRPDAWGARGSD